MQGYAKLILNVTQEFDLGVRGKFVFAFAFIEPHTISLATLAQGPSLFTLSIHAIVKTRRSP